jgi:Papain family cysteine protease
MSSSKSNPDQFIKKFKRPPPTLKLRSYSAQVSKEYLKMEMKLKGVYPGVIPKNLDGRLIWELREPIDQKSCGSCWACSSSSCLADRIHIYTGVDIRLSPVRPLLCNFFGKEQVDGSDMTDINQKMLSGEQGSCNGTTLPDALSFFYRLGTCEESCSQYDMTVGNKENATDMPLCQNVYGKNMDMCVDGKTPMRLFRALQIYRVGGTSVDNGSERDIREEIFMYGPVVSGFDVYADFYEWYGKGAKGVYKHGDSELLGGHAIEITGYGQMPDGTKFWQVKNSWGTDSGDGGYFKILRGTNECGIEENVMAMIPDLPGSLPVKFYAQATDENDLKIRNQLQMLDNGYGVNTAEEHNLTNTPSLFRKTDYNGFFATRNGVYSNVGKIMGTSNVIPDKDDLEAIKMLKGLTKEKYPWVIDSKRFRLPSFGSGNWLITIIIGLFVLLFLGVVGYILYRKFKYGSGSGRLIQIQPSRSTSYTMQQI